MSLCNDIEKMLVPNKEVSEASDIDSVLKELVDAKPSSDNAEQGKFVSLLKGMAFSDDPKATAFMSKVMGAIDKSFLPSMKEAADPAADKLAMKLAKAREVVQSVAGVVSKVLPKEEVGSKGKKISKQADKANKELSSLIDMVDSQL